MTALTEIVAGGQDRPLFEVEPQPGTCGSACPCTAPLDESDTGMRWAPEPAPAGRAYARTLLVQARALLGHESPADLVLAGRVLALDIAATAARPGRRGRA